MATRHAIAAGLAVLIGAGAWADNPAPLSAIDWLSNSVTEEVAPPSASTAETGAEAPPEIRVLPLDAPTVDETGLIAASDLGVPADLWGRSSADDLAAALNGVTLGADAPPSIGRFIASLLQARLDAPIDAAINDRFFLARLDRLLEKGHLATARDLIDATGSNAPQLFRRRFDIALLTGDETEMCREIESSPDLSPTYPARIFCLARLGQFDVAALTLGNAETLDILTPEEDALLLHFLDPELFEGDPIPTAPRLPTPLQFRLYEAVGERISTEGLPVPFAFADMSDTVGWKARLTAAERLAASRAIPFERLVEVFEERSPSASGGIWERVAAVQALSVAVRRKRDGLIFEALPDAWAAAERGGYDHALAAWLRPCLSKFSDAGAASATLFEVALLAGDVEAAARFANRSSEDRFLLSLALGRAGTEPAGDALGRAVLRGLSALTAGETFETLIREDRRGEVLFRALDQLAEGANGNPDTTANSLAALRRIGMDDLARQIAVELVLKEGAA